MEERGDEHLLIFVDLNRWEEERDVMEDREKYKYPLPPNNYLSAAVPLSRCGTAAPSKTARVKELLSWLS